MSTTFNAVDPRTGTPGPGFREATLDDVRAACEAAGRAALDPALRDRARRAEALRAAAAELRGAGDELVEVCEAETALPEPRLRGELERTCRQLEAFAEVLETGEDLDVVVDTRDPDAKPIPRPDLRRTTLPLGPVAVFGASNFPLAFGAGGGDTASALAAGCPVVVKGHPSHPGTGELVAERIRAGLGSAGLPEGAFAHLPASGIEVGEQLVDHPAIAAVAFTGSHGAGMALAARAAARPVPIPVYAEMGSINPVVVSDAALEARAGAVADAITAAVATFGGQLCTKPGLVYVPDTERGEAFTAAVAERLGSGEAPVLLSEGVARTLRQGLAEVERCGAARRLTPDGAPDGDGFRHPAVAYRTTVAELTRTPELGQERFGPVVVFAHYRDTDELLAALDALEGQLTGTVHAQPEEEDLLRAVAERLAARAGRVLFDGVPTGVAVSRAMVHGGPYPATTAPLHTSVGMTAIRRFQRPVVFQDAPAVVLPPELRDDNPLGIWRLVDGELTRGAL